MRLVSLLPLEAGSSRNLFRHGSILPFFLIIFPSFSLKGGRWRRQRHFRRRPRTRLSVLSGPLDEQALGFRPLRCRAGRIVSWTARGKVTCCFLHFNLYLFGFYVAILEYCNNCDWNVNEIVMIIPKWVLHLEIKMKKWTTSTLSTESL